VIALEEELEGEEGGEEDDGEADEVPRLGRVLP